MSGTVTPPTAPGGPLPGCDHGFLNPDLCPVCTPKTSPVAKAKHSEDVRKRK